MSDEELVKRLVDWSEHDEGKINDARQEAADRIEALTAKVKLMDDLDVINGEKIEALTAKLAGAEAKLAKAVELLRRHCDPMDMSNADVATLAEIEGEKG
jgi:ribosome recycling factor